MPVPILRFYVVAVYQDSTSYKCGSAGWVSGNPGQTVEVILQAVKKRTEGSAHLGGEFVVYEVWWPWTTLWQTFDCL